MKKICCPNCGTVVSIDETDMTKPGDWLQCLLPTGFEWKLPAGVIEPTYGEKQYVTALGAKLTRDEYIQKYSVDPEIALKHMRQNIFRRIQR